MADNAAFRASLRSVCDAARRIPEALGQRPTTVTLRTRTYSAGVAASGATLTSTADTVLSPRPKVTQVTDGQRSYFGGGTLVANDGAALAGCYEIGPITQDFPGGGYAQGSVLAAGATTKRLTVVLEGDEFSTGGEEFEVTQADWTRPHRGMLQVIRTRQGA